MITLNAVTFSDLFSSFKLSVRSVMDSFSSSPLYSKYRDIKNECVKMSYIWKQLYYQGILIDEFDYIFVPQKFHWDCGLACCAMAVKWLHRDFSAVNENILYLRETPLWTVELFCLLQELDVHCVMLTQHAGFTPSHSDISWYSENLTENESERVTACFAFAREKDWNVLQVSVCNQKLSELVGNSDFLAIILVDSETLTKRQRRVELFAGHYIVVVGYDPMSDTFFYLNPADCSGLKAVSGHLLEEARTHEGTDEDIILCCKSALCLEQFILSTSSSASASNPFVISH